MIILNFNSLYYFNVKYTKLYTLTLILILDALKRGVKLQTHELSTPVYSIIIRRKK